MNESAAWDPRRILSKPWAYVSLARILGGNIAMRRWVAEQLRIQPRERVLDIGCGPGRLCDFLPEVTYVGIDVSATYLDRARALYPRGRFEQLDLESDCSKFADRGFDLIVACGLVHHLTTAAAKRLFAFAHERLRNGGRLVTLDAVFWPGQHPVAKLLVSLDRGRFVRDTSGYDSLARSAFASVETIRHEDLLRVPYSHITLQCRK